MTVSIQTTNGFTVLVDDDDLEKVSPVRWHARRFKGGGYIYASSTDGKNTLMHRLITGASRGILVDHINGDTLDNRKKNLRLCSVAENSRNMHARRGVSAFKGIDWQQRHGNWRARITVNWKTIHIGCFNSEVDAARAYNSAALQHFGAFANLNAIESSGALPCAASGIATDSAP